MDEKKQPQNPGTAEIRVNTSIYPLDVIYSAAHIMTEKAYILLDGDPEKEVVVRITPKKAEDDTNTLAGEFNNELVNYATNKTKTKEMLEFRNIILNKIMSTNIKNDN